MPALLAAERSAHEIGLEIGDRVDARLPDDDRTGDRPRIRAHVHACAREQPRAEPEPRGGVVVAGDRNDGADLAEPRQRVVGKADRVDRRQGPVVEVAGHEDRVDRLVARDVRQVLHHSRLRVEQRLAVERATQVPVGSVQEAHPTQGAARSGRNLRRAPRRFPLRLLG